MKKKEKLKNTNYKLLNLKFFKNENLKLKQKSIKCL